MSEAKENLDNSEFECDETEITALGEPYGFHEDESAETMEEREAKEHGEITRLAAELEEVKRERDEARVDALKWSTAYALSSRVSGSTLFDSYKKAVDAVFKYRKLHPNWRPRKRG